MKKIISLITAFMLTAALLAGCGSTGNGTADQTDKQENSGTQTQAEPVDVNVMALKGPTAMGMVKLMDDADSGNVDTENYSFEIAASADEVTPKLIQGETDIAAVPANLASVLYNKTEGQIQVLAVNTLGVLYIVENGDSIHSVSDLAGRTIYASGKGSTPEYALNFILEKNGLTPGTDVTIEWKSEHSECVSALAQDPEGIAMLPQPFVTTAQAKNPNLKVALDLTEEWDKVMENEETKSSLLTGVVVVRKEFAEENPEAVEDFMDRYADSVKYVNDNVEEAAKLVGNYDIVTEDVAVKAIPECNIVCITGEDMKEQLSGYLAVLKDANPESIGGELPGDDFYYIQ
ncbi:MAG TPA: PhnD/SsuA/transferrin family substrate-binding protein [Candidatus Mediterraneibacter caccogallinarum]|nr:PhnD/SsuA/transferrin family substrate-binding protein [Candidatus Mediterraneibacter caccogallinarum]